MEHTDNVNKAAGAPSALNAGLEGAKPKHVIFWPAQCGCGHIFLEKYQFPELTEKGNIGFCWCGFCRTKRMVGLVT